MRAIIAIAMVLAASVANAAPVYLSCSGEWRNGSIGPIEGSATIPISFDTDKGTVTYEQKKLKIYIGSNLEIRAAEHVLETGFYGLDVRLNRLTGGIFIETDPVPTHGAWSSFSGTCKPTRKLF